MAKLVPCAMSSESIAESEYPSADEAGYCTHNECIEFNQEWAAYKSSVFYGAEYDEDLNAAVEGDTELLADEYHVR